MSKLLVVVGVHFCNDDLLVRMLEARGKLFVYGGEGFAVCLSVRKEMELCQELHTSTPGREELDESRGAGLENDIIKVLGGEVNDCRSSAGGRKGESR